MRKETYIAQPKYRDSTDSMRHHSPPEYLHVACAYAQVPDEISQGETLTQSTKAIVSPQPALPCVIPRLSRGTYTSP